MKTPGVSLLLLEWVKVPHWLGSGLGGLLIWTWAILPHALAFEVELDSSVISLHGIRANV